ncbi:MAG: FG-GAP-like repeat-containing protein [Thermodesulfobacteriota bacterium]
MIRPAYIAAFLLAALLLIPASSPAAAEGQVKTFAVLPFTVNGPEKFQYFGRGIQDMLISRLEWQEHLVHIAKEKVGDKIAAAPASDADAASGLAKVDGDFLVWGSVTILGDQCSVDVRVTEKAGKTWPKSAQTTLAGLIPSLDAIARDINAEIFQRPQDKAQQEAKKQAAAPSNPDIVVNESRADQVYLNPQFRYEGGDDSPGRWRSPALPFTSVGCVVGDLDSDGKNEVVFIDNHYVRAFEYNERRLTPLAEIAPSPRAQLLNINLIDINRDGLQEIVVSADLEGMPVSFVLNYADRQFKVVDKDINFYMSVIKFPPTYSPVLVGQRPGSGGKLFESTVHEVVRMSKEYSLGKRVAHPDGANVFNFAYLPLEGGDYKVIMVTDQDHLQVLTPKFELQHATSDQFAGSALGFERPDVIGGFGANRNMHTVTYYIPLRLVAVNLERGPKHELLVNKDISVAAQFFQRYRYFPEGEIHSLFWDGVGLSLSWKTRRIKGSVADYGVADVNNDGKPELYVCVNSYPGHSGFGERKTLLMTYTLDMSSGDATIPLRREE